MTLLEFSTEFDILFNNIMSDTAPSVNEYEKSVFLTKAQNEIVKNYFNPKGNKYQEGYDGSLKRQSDFSMLVTISEVSAEPSPVLTFNHDCSSTFEIPENLMIYIQESLEVTSGDSTKVLQVIPLRYDEYIRLNSRPYKYPARDQAWRVIGNSSTDSRNAQLIYHPGETVQTNGYTIVYVRKPQPIIISDLTSTGLSIDGVSTVSECELDSEIHPEILQRAVEIAKVTYSGDVAAIIQTGNRSE